ncbi:hypothetical protein [Ruminococcus sp.]|uniref:hypothetical protein n=1 Tax=Ruminococcus sp. TaxID=41978 RepID=UPI001B3E2E27|nr:hypothetical protein [Ruminococcus sp.]MBP5432823.1 hypothetical protein [Ruminococcus sp.]
MISRVTADFENIELAELALKRVRDSVGYVYSAKMMYKTSPDVMLKRSGRSAFSLYPTYYNSNINYLKDVIGSSASDEPVTRSKTKYRITTCIVCGSAAVDNVISVLCAMGGTNISFAG